MKFNLLLVLIIFSHNLFSQWNTNTSINTPIALAPKSQSSVHTVSDSNGGIIMVWDDNRNDATTKDDIYAQRINASGVRKWPLYGIAICDTAFAQKNSTITDSDNGSAIIAWQDNRSGNTDIYAQKIDSSGIVLWTANGVAICTKTTVQKSPKIVGDDAGGAYIVWEDSLANYWDIYAQHINSSGVLSWASGGVSICSAGNTQSNPRIESDGLGNAIFTWQDKRNNIDYDIYAQKINLAGNVQWTANGVAICTSINVQNNPRIDPDGANGAIIAWVDKRNGLDNNIYAQRINSSGVTQWTAGGTIVCNATNNQSAIDMKYIGSTGILFSWKDDRTNTSEIYAQIMSLSGTAQLASNGIKISNALKSLNPNAISDGNGGAIIAWQDSTILGWDIKSQKLDANGAIQWANGGVIVSDAGDNQENASQVADGNGGAIYAWEDHRNGSNNDIYAQHLYDNGTSIVGIKELSKSNNIHSLCYPNPITSNSIIRLTNAQNLSWQINVFNAYGNLISSETIKNNDSYNLHSSAYAAGMYFYFITINGETSYSKGSFISSN